MPGLSLLCDDLWRILHVWQTEAPCIWRFLSQTNLLLSVSLRIYSLGYTLTAPSPWSCTVWMWHHLLFMILAWTQSSKKDVGAAVQEWETEQGARFLPVSGLHSTCLLLQCLVSPKADFFPFPSLPDENCFTCPRLSFLWLYGTSRAATSDPCLEIPKEIPQTTSKGTVKSKWKKKCTICRLKTTTVGFTLPLDYFSFFFTRSLQNQTKGGKLLTQIYATQSKIYSLGFLPLSHGVTWTGLIMGRRHFPKSLFAFQQFFGHSSNVSARGLGLSRGDRNCGLTRGSRPQK